MEQKSICFNSTGLHHLPRNDTTLIKVTQSQYVSSNRLYYIAILSWNFRELILEHNTGKLGIFLHRLTQKQLLTHEITV